MRNILLDFIQKTISICRNFQACLITNRTWTLVKNADFQALHLHTEISHFITLCLLHLSRYCIFKQYCATLCCKSIGSIFLTACPHFVSLCHILIFLVIFQIFLLSLYMLWWSVIFDVPIAIVWKRYQLNSHKITNLNDKCCVCSECSTDWLFLHCSLSPRASLFPKKQQY